MLGNKKLAVCQNKYKNDKIKTKKYFFLYKAYINNNKNAGANTYGLDKNSLHVDPIPTIAKNAIVHKNGYLTEIPLKKENIVLPTSATIITAYNFIAKNNGVINVNGNITK